MKTTNVIKEDLQRISKNRFVRLALLAIIIVPILYSFMYLYAFWDPYNNLANMKVAVVNLDTGATIHNENKNVGDQIVENLQTNDDLGWEFVDEKTAAAGLLGDTYYAEMIIPQDFSEKVLSATDSNQIKGELTFITNDKKNFLASQIIGKIETVLSNEITTDIVKEYTTATFIQLSDIEKGMQEASNGANQLATGISDAQAGSLALRDGNKQLAEQVNTSITAVENSEIYDLLLHVDTTSLKSMAADAQVLAASNITPVTSLSTTITQNQTSINKLFADYSTIKSNPFLTPALIADLQSTVSPSSISQAENLATDAEQLQTDLQTMNESLDQNKVQNIINNSDEVKMALTTIAQAGTEITHVQQLLDEQSMTASTYLEATTDFASNEQVNNYQDALASIDTTNMTPAQITALQQAQALAPVTLNTRTEMENTQPAVDDAKASLSAIQTSLEKSSVQDTMSLGRELVATDYFATLSTDLSKINNSYTTFQPTLETMKKIIGEVKTDDGQKFLQQANTLAGDVATAQPVIEKMMNQLATPEMQSLPQLAQRLSSMQTGLRTNQRLLAAVGDVQADAIQATLQQIPVLQDGVNELATGSTTLSSGLDQLVSGSNNLALALGDGSTQLESGLMHTPEEMGAFISQPLAVNAQAENKVSQYGVGFAPYFIPLSLWVGALMMFFVIDPRTHVKTSSFKQVMSKYLIYAVIGIIQAVFVSVAIMALGLTTTSVPLFLFTNIMISLVFVSIMLTLILVLGDIGRLLSIVMLILQLTSAGGTFPVTLVPGLFQFLHPVLPFSYAVDALRDVISATSINYGLVFGDIGVMMLFGIGFLAIAIIFCKPGVRFVEQIEKKLHG